MVQPSLFEVCTAYVPDSVMWYVCDVALGMGTPLCNHWYVVAGEEISNEPSIVMEGCGAAGRTRTWIVASVLQPSYSAVTVYVVLVLGNAHGVAHVEQLRLAAVAHV